jgi:fumarate reductase subunit C
MNGPMLDSGKRWAARVDVLQSLTGLCLVLFVWAHMFFESSILLGKDAMLWVTRMFEGVPLFGEPYPQLVSLAGFVIFALLLLHALSALRKFPGNYRQYRAFREHMQLMRHGDTTLWYVQAVTGFLLFFLASAHLVQVILQPDQIGPYASSDRIWGGRFWLLYAPLLLVVHLHAGIGFYRLWMKWAPPASAHQRVVLRRAMWGVVVFFMLLGSASLVTYMRIGYEHADRAGERYHPAGASTMDGDY